MGTKSLLWGVHAFWWHPITVWLAWRDLYGRPTWRESVCIFVHDWGYYGCTSMDGRDGKNHPRLGASIAWWLFGIDYEELVLFHSRAYAEAFGRSPSKLCWPDKLSMLYEPGWFYLFRARLTGEILEYHLNAIQCGFIHDLSTEEEWLTKVTDYLARMARREARNFA